MLYNISPTCVPIAKALEHWHDGIAEATLSSNGLRQDRGTARDLQMKRWFDQPKKGSEQAKMDENGGLTIENWGCASEHGFTLW